MVRFVSLLFAVTVSMVYSTPAFACGYDYEDYGYPIFLTANQVENPLLWRGAYWEGMKIEVYFGLEGMTGGMSSPAYGRYSMMVNRPPKAPTSAM